MSKRRNLVLTIFLAGLGFYAVTGCSGRESDSSAVSIPEAALSSVPTTAVTAAPTTAAPTTAVTAAPITATATATESESESDSDSDPVSDPKSCPHLDDVFPESVTIFCVVAVPDEYLVIADTEDKIFGGCWTQPLPGIPVYSVDDDVWRSLPVHPAFYDPDIPSIAMCNISWGDYYDVDYAVAAKAWIADAAALIEGA